MNKLFIFFIIFLGSVENVWSQDDYVKFTKDTLLSEQNLKILHGEIFQVDKKDSKLNLIYFGKKVVKFQVNSEAYESVAIDNDYAKSKNNYVKINEEGHVYVDFKSIPTSTDPIRIVTESQTEIPFSERKVEEVKNELGDEFRVIIPNTPSIFYNKKDLTKYSPPLLPEQTININETVGGDKEKVSTVMYLIYLGIALLLLLLLLFILYKKGIIFSDKEPIYKKFNGGSLTEFAKQNNIKKGILIKWNLDIDPNYEYLDENARMNAKSNIIGRDLKIGYQKKPKITLRTRELDTVDVNSHDKKNVTQVLSKGLNDDDIQRKILTEVQNINSRLNDYSTELRSNSNKFNALETEARKLKTENENLEKYIIQLKEEKQSIEKNFQSEKEVTKKQKNDFDLFNGKVILVGDRLKGYCEAVYSYLSLCNDVSTQAYNFFNQFILKDPLQAGILGNLLINYQSTINEIQIGKWQQIVQDIKETGATTNKQLIRRFSETQNESDSQKEFSRLLFTESLIAYSSCILILAESFKNLSRFQISSALAIDIQNSFAKHVSELLNKLKSLGLEAKYVPLFKNYMDNLGQAKSVDKKLSLAYQSVKGLEKDFVAEVISYGFKNTFGFGETDTLIILA